MNKRYVRYLSFFLANIKSKFNDNNNFVCSSLAYLIQTIIINVYFFALVNELRTDLRVNLFIYATYYYYKFGQVLRDEEVDPTILTKKYR